MRAGVAVIVAMTWFLPGLARTQPDTAVADGASAISLHPDIMTVLQLPEAVVSARTLHRADFRVGFYASRIYVQPRPDTPAGAEALLEVETATQQHRFRLRAVAHADEATKIFLVRAPEAEQVAEHAQPAAPPEAAPAPSTSLPGTQSPSLLDAPPLSLPGTPPPNLQDALTPPRTPDANGAPRFDLSVHAVVSLAGTTALHVEGYEARSARQPHRAFGMRVAGARPGSWWAVEANVTGEWPAAPSVHDGIDNDGGYTIEIRGPWLRADVGMRAQLRTRWSPTAYAGLGLQAHHRDIEESMNEDDGPKGDMPLGGVLVLGLGLQYRAGDVLLGLDLHVRQGVPDDYHSVAALLSVGCFLHQGE